MNPYPDFKVSKCPHCEATTGQRKVPLLIHIKPTHFAARLVPPRPRAACGNAARIARVGEGFTQLMPAK